MENFSQLLYNIFWLLFYIVFLIGFFSWLIYSIIYWRRNSYIKSHQYKLTFLHIKLPPQNEYEIEAAEHLFASLMGFRRSFFQSLFKGQRRISFEIVSKKEGIGFYVVVPDELVNFVEKQINGAYPTAEIDVIDPNEIWDRGKVTEIVELKLSGPPYYPIKTYKSMEATDPLSSVTSSLSKLKETEVVAIQYLISPAGSGWRRAGNAFVGHIHNKSSNPEKNIRVDTAFLEGVEEKTSKPGFELKIRIVAISDDKISARNHIDNVATSFEQFTNVKYSNFRRRKIIFTKKLISNFIYRKMVPRTFQIPIFDIVLYSNITVLNIEEMATIFHFPSKEIQTPNILWLTARKAPAPSNTPEEGLYLGKNVYRNTEKKLFMNADDRTRHMYIIGQTGTGKSEFMKTLAIQDIYNGEGLAFIDPHGSDIDDILKKIPEHRVDDVILFDVSDTENPVGLNMLEAHTEEEKHMLINSFIGLLYKLYDPNRQGIMGPQLERSIRNVMLTAMSDPDATMVDVLRLLIDEEYVKQFLPKITDPLVKRYWTDEMAKTTANRKGEMMGYFVSKFDRLVTERTMRNIIGQKKSSFNLHQVMRDKKILLVDLSKGKIGEENSNFLGLLIVPRILSAALARASLLGKEEFPNFYLYVDEFQNFATDDFATILSEARKYKLNLTVAHQFVAQLQEEIKEAVFGNVGTTVSFRVGVDDAEYLEQQFEPIFTQSDLINLPVGNYYIRLLVKGHPTVPFSAMVDWDVVNQTVKSDEIAERIRKDSRERYGTPVAEVEEFINERAGYNPEPEPEPMPSQVDPRKLIPF